MIGIWLIINFVIIIQLINDVEVIRDKYENHVAFFCDHPAMVYRNYKWVPDFQQNCIKDELGIVTYCRQSFPNENISSAEPAVERISFSEWCDFEGRNCTKDVKIRPFKCLKTDFQSDALTLPKDCLFAHLGGKAVCKLYKDWVVDAKEQCSKKTNWKLKSYGMLFQCGRWNTVAPMHFRGVEFVCCPNDGVGTQSNQNVYKNYLLNGVLESEKSEESVYSDALKRLEQSETETKRDIIADYKNGEKDLMKLWTTDPNLARSKENALISQFKVAFNAVIDQYTANKEQLLIFHDDRLKFIFSTKLEVAMNHLRDLLKRDSKDETKILEAMKSVLSLLMVRKREIRQERFWDQSLGSNMIHNLDKELTAIDNNITELFNQLDQIPQFKVAIKEHLVKFLNDKFPRLSREQLNERDDIPDKIFEINRIISKYRHRQGRNRNDGFQVHYDLGLHDKDESDQYVKGGQKFIFDHETMVEQFDDKRMLFTLVTGTLITAFLILLIGSALILYRHRSSMIRYRKPKYQNDPCKPALQGFGVQSTNDVKDKINIIPFRVYENPTYKVIQTTLKTDPDTPTSEYVDGSLSSPLIES